MKGSHSAHHHRSDVHLPIRLSTVVCVGCATAPCAAVFKVLDVVHELLTSGKQATQRDIYYKVGCQPCILRKPASAA
jgi:hypothetical protein